MLHNRSVGVKVEQICKYAHVGSCIIRDNSPSHNFCSFDRGSAILCSAEDGQHVFISNLHDGVDQYRFPSMEKVQSFRFSVKEGSESFNLRVAACDNNPFVVCGGIDGIARVFDRRSGELFQKLKHGDGV